MFRGIVNMLFLSYIFENRVKNAFIVSPQVQHLQKLLSSVDQSQRTISRWNFPQCCTYGYIIMVNQLWKVLLKDS